MQQRWPDRLWVVRHGESSGNVAREAARAARLTHIDTGGRDVDVPLQRPGGAAIDGARPLVRRACRKGSGRMWS